MKMCGEWNNISANFYLGTVWRRVNSSIWGEEPPVIIAYEVEYVPEPVWTLWRRENYFTDGNRTRVFLPVGLIIG